MKKRLLYGAGIVVVILLVWAGIFAWKNLRGIGPVVRKPSFDITEIVSPKVGDTISKNVTGLPLTLPPGFSISIFAKGLGKPRVMTKDEAGNILVSIPSQGKVVALSDFNDDGVAEATTTVIDGLNRPHGLLMDCRDTSVAMPVSRCHLFIAETSAVVRYDYNTDTRKATRRHVLFTLPTGGNHFTRTIIALPNDERLAVSVGSSCNVCNEKDWRRAVILITNQEGTAVEPFASGLRNAVFMAVQPETGKLWATEMGRDLLGDDLPPDEINIVERGDYGWPYCYGKQVHDDAFDPKKTRSCDKTIPSTIDLPAHSAPLGLAFVPNPSTSSGDNGWPKEYEGDLLVAFHGSWNRSEPTGYKVVRYPLNEKGEREVEPVDFISGWLQKDGAALGRPVDLLVEENGVMYISDDKAGVVYRVQYQKS